MEYEIIKTNPSELLKVKLKLGEEIRSTTGSIVSSVGKVEVNNKSQLFSMKNLIAYFLGDKFVTHLIKANEDSEVVLSSNDCSPVHKILLKDDKSIYIKPKCYLMSQDITLDIKFVNYESYLFLSGSGVLFLSGKGGIREIDLNDPEDFRINEKYLLGYEDTIEVKSQNELKDLDTTIMQGAELIAITGSGKVWVQSHKG